MISYKITTTESDSSGRIVTSVKFYGKKCLMCKFHIYTSTKIAFIPIKYLSFYFAINRNNLKIKCLYETIEL